MLRRGLLIQIAAVSAGCLDGLESLETDASRIEVDPSPSATTLIQQALDQGLEVVLQKGTYVLSAPLVLRSGARLFGAGSGLTKLVAGFAPLETAADDRENALLVIDGLVLPIQATQLAASAAKDAWTLTLAHPLEGLAPDQWVRVHGSNDIEDSHEMSDDAPLCEILRVQSVDDTNVTLDTVTMQFHSVGVAVDVVEPSLDVEISGFDVSAEGGTVAVGVMVGLAADVRITDVSGAGFSRALIDLGPGSRTVQLREIRSRGEVNAIVHADSSMDIHIESVLSVPGGARAHVFGVPRALLTFVHRCTSAIVTSGVLENGCIGIRTWGGHHLHFSDILIRDMEPSEALARDEILSGGAYPIGVGIDGGAGRLDHAEFARDISFNNVHLEDCRQPTESTQAGWFLHDMFGVTISGCSIVNKGLTSWTDGSHVTGMLAVDCSGSIESLMIQGASYSFRTGNAAADLNVGFLEINGAPGTGYAGLFALFFNHVTTYASRGPQFAKVKLNNVLFYADTGPDFNLMPDWEMFVESYYADGFEASNCVMCKEVEASRFSVGEIAEISETSMGKARELVTPTGPSTRNVVVASAKGVNQFVLAAPLPTSRAHVLCSTAAVTVGDLLVASATHPRRAEVDNAPVNPFVVIGKALTNKAAGVEGLVLVGPA
ncbi:MAG: hypothetical protein HOW73_03555 [Polyangiaceae bacterium]|nr:hypothetical protein [Polyangiaceae bacterium]